MKDFRKLLQGKYFLGILLSVSVISLTLSPAFAESETPVKPETEPLRIETFSDRKTLKEGEEIGIKVWIDSELIDHTTVTVFFPESQLDLKENLSCQNGVKKNYSCEVDLPRSNPVNFAFTGKKKGKFSLLIQVSGENTKTKQEITERQQIQDIEIQEQAQWGSKLLSSPFLGVLIGGVLTIVTTVFTNWLQSSLAKGQRREWIKTNLPAQLELTRQAIFQRRETGFELWMDKLRTEGYYTELQRFARRKPGHEDLAEQLLNIAFRLRDYEQDRKTFPLKELEEEHREIAQDLEQIIRIMKNT
ncbi:MAG: hypothetical protein QNJ55_24180 [Xenococcus sp. MO_188.B8]|nr:hypothetical protein [Xenococcus sp. MO_188.B8]